MHARFRPGLAWGLCLCVAAGACGDDSEDEASASAALGSTSRGERRRTDWTARLDPEQAPAITDVLAALEQGHEQARRVIGPHRLEWEATFSLVPEDGAAAGETPVGQRAVTEQQVADALTLEWAARADESEPRFHLEQHNDHDRGREVIVTEGTMYVRPRFRGWSYNAIETDVWRLWLDDAQRAAHDIIELAAPRLRLVPSTRAGAGIAGGDAVAYALELGDEQTTTTVGVGRAWRARARIDGVEGELVVDRSSGLWLSCDVVVRYGVDGADGRPLRGEARVRGSVEAAAQGAIAVAAPAGALPGTQRIRYEIEREELLDGLIGP